MDVIQMNKYIEIHGDKWKLKDIQEELDWCKNQKWELKTYTKKDDHEHCRICFWTIGISDDPEIGQAYWNQGNHWLCQECYKKFIKKTV